jgi:lantibiotic modifying enzyme
MTPRPHSFLRTVSEEPVFSTQDALAEAFSIAQTIAAHATINGQRTYWLTYAYDPHLRKRRLQPMSFRLYDGVCGTAVFLAAAGRSFDSPHLRALALTALRGVTALVRDNPRELFQFGIGAGIGVSSAIYALSLVGRMLDCPEFLDDAQALVSAVTSEDIASDRAFDLLSGAAGCLLTLLRFYRLRPETSTLELAVRCGEHLLAHRSQCPSGFLAWATSQGQLRTGFAHGAAGICYALVELYAATGDERFLAAATEAREFENNLYSEKHANWLACPGTVPSPNRWCNGAAGIGLGRLATLSISDGRNDVADVKRALDVASRSPGTVLDYPCCGNLGVMELSLLASQQLGMPQARQQAEYLTHHVIRKARLHGLYGLEPQENIYNPSFYQGMAGIGYQLLRFALPYQIPSMLLWK